MRKLIISLLFVGALVGITVIFTSPSAAAPSATFYVATDGSNESGDGSAGNPWAAITHALDTVPDGSLILVKPGTYNGRVRLRGQFTNGVVVRSEQPYQAKLRHDSTVITCFYGQGITLEGFDIAHDGSEAGALVIQIQDLIDEPGGSDIVSRITLRNNILHDSYNNDILKINNGAGQITVEGNMFFNQTGSDEHIDINSVENVIVQDNIFFNDFAGSNRPNNNNTSSYIVIKDSNGNSDGIQGSRHITVRRNVFLNWEGSTGSNFVLVGEDGNPYFEGRDIAVENNLMLGNSSHVMRAAFGVKGGQNILFRHNTVVGNLPSLAFAFRLNREQDNPANENIQFYNNIWADLDGTMNDFSDTPAGHTTSFMLDWNLYWNDGSAIPQSGDDMINYTDDTNRIVANPQLPNQSSLIVPHWDSDTQMFRDGSESIREAFVKLVGQNGRLGDNSPAIDTSNPSQAVSEDILGNPRVNADLGAVEHILLNEKVYLPIIKK